MNGEMIKIWTRDYNLNFMTTVVWCLNFDSLKFLKRSFKSALAEGDSGKTSFWMAENEQNSFNRIITQSFLRNIKSFEKYLLFYEKSKERFTDVSRKINSTKLKKQYNHSLGKIYKNFEINHCQFMLVGQWIAFNLIEIIPGFLRQKLLEEKIKLEQINKIIPIVLFPSKDKAVSKMEEEIFKIALDFKRGLLSDNKRGEAVKLLVKKYGWIPAIIPEIPLWDEKFFQNRIKDATKDPNLEEAIQKIADSKKEKQKMKNNFNNILRQYPKLRELFLIAQKLTDLKDERDEARRFAYFLVRPLYYEIASRAKLKIDELVILSPTEIYNFLQKEKLPTLEEINQRKKNFIVYVLNKKFKIYSGKQAADFSKKYLISKEKIEKESFSGIIASPGKVKGIVKTVLDKKDLYRVREGEILVAITTHPDYLSVMKKAKAIITDEGGLTSHAAIVSREFKIPCIVGTKIATKVLKDGDLVEVDADKGVVKIIKKFNGS